MTIDELKAEIEKELAKLKNTLDFGSNCDAHYYVGYKNGSTWVLSLIEKGE